MKEYYPSSLLKVPRWTETVLQCGIFVLVALVLHKTHLDSIVFNVVIFTNDIRTVMFIFFVFYVYKVLGTHTAVDHVKIDYQLQEITFNYWLFYFIKKTVRIRFPELSIKNRNDILLLGGSEGLYIYQNGRLKIKLNTRNGWKKEQMKQLSIELKSILQDLKTFLETSGQT